VNLNEMTGLRYNTQSLNKLKAGHVEVSEMKWPGFCPYDKGNGGGKGAEVKFHFYFENWALTSSRPISYVGSLTPIN
jgi:hypothetical protein